MFARVLPMRIRSLLKYLPVLSIVLVALTLLVIVVLFTLRTINYQNERMEEFTARQGVAVIRTLEAGTRTDYMEGVWGVENLQMLIEQGAKDPDVEWVGLINSNGMIVAHSEPAEIGLRLVPGCEDMKIVRKVIATGEPHIFKREIAEDRQIFEIWKPFTPFHDQLAQDEIISRQTVIGKELLDVFDRDPKHVLFVGLKMDRFRQIRRQDITYAIFMGVILFIIGSAGIYFIFVIQNSYLVRRTLDEMRTYTRNVLESMPNGLISVDRSMTVATFNPTALEVLRKSKDEVKGRPIEELLPLEEEVKQVLSDSSAIVDKEVKIVQDGKGKSFIALSVSPLKQPDSELSSGAVIILRDMTVIRELEHKVALNEKFAALGRLSAGVAHEIRNPLNSIRGFIQYFQKKLNLDGEDLRYTELMLTEVDRLNRVISKLLAYSKPREPRLAVRAVDEILDHCVKVVEREASEAGVQIVRAPVHDGAPLVLMDSDQMTQVFLNLLINAVEATERDGQVVVGYDVDEAGRPVVCVQDTGPGIPREDLDKVFDPFFSTKKKGTGLGLAIVKSIIEGHGGEIEVDSEPGRGTRFLITLKTYDGSEEDTIETTAAALTKSAGMM